MKPEGKPHYRWNGVAWILTRWQWRSSKFPQKLKQPGAT